MSRGACTFKERDVKAAVKAAQAAGLPIAGVEITKDGTIRVIAGSAVSKPDNAGPGEWDDLK